MLKTEKDIMTDFSSASAAVSTPLSTATPTSPSAQSASAAAATASAVAAASLIHSASQINELSGPSSNIYMSGLFSNVHFPKAIYCDYFSFFSK